MNWSRRLFRVWVALTALWTANIALGTFVSWRAGDHVIMTMQWALHWAILPPAALLLAGWLILRVAHGFRRN
jgi:hypothetical protein